MSRYRIIHRERNKLQKDGFTYGDWRQYVAFFPDKSAVSCRISGLPATVAMIGFLFLMMAATGVSATFGADGDLANIIWPRVFWTALIGLVLTIPWALTWFTPWRLVVPVSGVIYPDESGSYWRDI